MSGSEVTKILLAAGIMPREKFNELLKEALDEIRGSPRQPITRPGSWSAGSALDNPQLIEIIEGLGGMVVTDSLCFGSRHFLNPIEEDGDPLEAIAKRYYYHNPCPRMMGEFKNRLRFTEEMAQGSQRGRHHSSEDRLLRQPCRGEHHAGRGIRTHEHSGHGSGKRAHDFGCGKIKNQDRSLYGKNRQEVRK